MKIVLPPEGRSDLLRYMRHVAGIQGAIRLRWRAHAYERELCGADRLVDGTGGTQAPRRDGLRYQAAQPWLHDRRTTASNIIDFVGIDVDGYDLMSVPREARRRNCTDVADTENADIHAAFQDLRVALSQTPAAGIAFGSASWLAIVCCQYAFFSHRVTKHVRTTINTSNHRLQLLMYQTSCSTLRFIRSICAVSPRKQLTCAHPVSPGFT
jgi:hypothetical protein